MISSEPWRQQSEHETKYPRIHTNRTIRMVREKRSPAGVGSTYKTVCGAHRSRIVTALRTIHDRKTNRKTTIIGTTVRTRITADMCINVYVQYIFYPYIPCNICTYVVHGYRYTYISRYVYILLYDARDRYARFSALRFRRYDVGVRVCGCGPCKNARRPSADHVWPRERMYIIIYRLRPVPEALQQPLRDLHRRITRGIYNTMYRPGNRALTRTACFMAAARNVIMCVSVWVQVRRRSMAARSERKGRNGHLWERPLSTTALHTVHPCPTSASLLGSGGDPAAEQCKRGGRGYS